jgi:hypothetical protein
MSQLESYKQLVRDHGWNMTLGEILRTPYAAEYRKLNCLLRREGWSVVCVQNKVNPGQNGYGFVEPDPTGQRLLGLMVSQFNEELKRVEGAL